MTTLKLKKPAAPGAPAERRGPLRSGGVKPPRPTLAQADAERARRREEFDAPAPPTDRTRAQRQGQRPAPRTAQRAMPPSPTRRPPHADPRAEPAAEPQRPEPPARRSGQAAPHPSRQQREQRREQHGPQQEQPQQARQQWAQGHKPQQAQPWTQERRPQQAQPWTQERRPQQAQPRTQERRPQQAQPWTQERGPQQAQPWTQQRTQDRTQERMHAQDRTQGRLPPRPPARVHEPMPRPSAAQPDTPRLSKRMSELGLASRREADEWIERGFVKVDGVVVDQLGARVRPEQQITIEADARLEQAQRVTVLLHKPLGYVSGQAEDGHIPALTLVTAATRWKGDATKQRFNAHQLRHLVAAGRLDLDSTGLLVLTQDGRVAKQLIGEDSLIEKEYVVEVRWNEQPDLVALHQGFPPEQLERMRHGMEIDGLALKPVKVSWQNECHLRVVLREGKRRQIRRMCEQVGLKVLSLKRIRIGRIGLGELPAGQWRYLGPFESFV